ncbi:hypothetical protein AWM75_03785 [Aerococcus urinaehominis]|uniref:Uncharacterized protein n=1 Tax=Aerococcus urinaehominis TaxID=128944 RepID=A0A0X8FKW1_9LACT|nr:DEAD/DEAH box helicase [Aerococcus urinaehominis]AMB99179.1 hypothetical protein AWM75_03785 [Aerococcus urinaehominis]SDM06484.1 Superfamily II DNA and RNA helicase [Aerococcus urinaehominis]
MQYLPPNLQSVWQANGFSDATDVQKALYPAITAGQDILASSPTGSGKTLAYLLPLLAKTEKSDLAQVLIVAPSKELVSQIADTCQAWQVNQEITSQRILGGANIQRQIDRLKKKPEIIIASLGRLLELINRKKIKLHDLKAVVLDEFDVLCDEEHQADTLSLLKKVPGQTQLIGVQATKQASSQELMTSLRPNYQSFDFASLGTAFANQRLDAYIEVPVRKRSDLLRRLAHLTDMSALVFVATLAESQLVSQRLDHHQISHALLTGDMSDRQRQQAISQFRQGRLTYLLTTDLAARGLDFPKLPYVIQYDPAQDQAQYVHRAGRTGRAGQPGTVLSLVNERSLRQLKQILPDDIKLVQRFVQGGQLVDNITSSVVASDASRERPGKKLGQSSKARKKQPHLRPTDQNKTKGRKKNRHRQQKNKGRRQAHKKQ